MEKRPIHPQITSDVWKVRLDNKLASKSICERDAELISVYLNDKILSSGGTLTESRKLKIVNHLTIFCARFLMPSMTYTTMDNIGWKAAAGKLFADGRNIHDKPFSENTKHDYILILKGFLRWLVSNGYANPNLTEAGINLVKNPPHIYVTKTDADLLNDDDIYKILSDPSCGVELGALIALLYWTGARIGEILSLTWADLGFEHQLLKVRIYAPKTRNYRYSPCSEALEYVASWRNKYPSVIQGGPNGSNPVFISWDNRTGQYVTMQYPNARKQVQAVCDKVLNRHITVHSFRASDITNNAKRGVPDSINKAIHWGNQSTNMLRTYTLLSDADIDNAVRKRAGLETETAELPVPRLCPICNTLNNPNMEYCRNCGAALTRDTKKRQIELRTAAVDAQKEKSIFEAVSVMADALGIDRDTLMTLMGSAGKGRL